QKVIFLPLKSKHYKGISSIQSLRFLACRFFDNLAKLSKRKINDLQITYFEPKKINESTVIIIPLPIIAAKLQMAHIKIIS
ncbi:MAG: hypothetical protein DRR19_25610, partial [Candidatus Parabeggiatoa sp. nov. 1]